MSDLTKGQGRPVDDGVSMEATDLSNRRQLALIVVEQTGASEKKALAAWLEKLMQIRDSDARSHQKARKAIGITLSSKVIWPMVKLIGKHVRKIGWTERGWTSRFGLLGAGLGLVFFSGQSAGIAALGGAIGVPLWVVFGSGAAFANILREEISRSLRERTDIVVPHTVEGEKASDEGRKG